MARQSRNQTLARIRKTTGAWEAFAAEVVFHGLTLAGLRSSVQPSYDTRAEIEDLQMRLRHARERRDAADAESMRLVEHVAYSVRGTPGYGPTCALYAAMGYVPDNSRRKRRPKTTKTK